MTEAALSDLRVIEYAQGISGPFCAKALADLGADVVKIEPPQGDRSRTHDPFPNDEPHPERSGRFLYLNANKRGISLSLETDLGRAIFRELVVDVDLLICDLPPSLVAGLPGRSGDSPTFDYGPAPLFGEHSEEVLCSLLGRSKEEFEVLVAAEVVY